MTWQTGTGNILLQVQFDKQGLKMQLALLDFFANPVAKNAEPIYDKNAHLTWYRGVQPPEPMRAVILENQFGKFEIRRGKGTGCSSRLTRWNRGVCTPRHSITTRCTKWWTWGTYPISPSSCEINSAPPRLGWDDRSFCSSSQKTPRDEGVSHPERARPPADFCNHPAQP